MENTHQMDIILILILAIGIDLVLGDPPTLLHPVGWMGKAISLMEKLAPKKSARLQIFYGITIVIVGTAAFSVPVYFLMEYLDQLHRIVYIIVGALLLKSTFSIMGLRRSALRITKRLKNNNLESAKAQMSSLVSRDTNDLDEPLIVAATVESVAENTSDSIVAPLFWFLILGLPGAIGYRMINTFDSMIGYRGEYEHLGKFAARLDDVVNYIPARLTGLMIVLAAFISRNKTNDAWGIMIRDHSKTASPNAGWPMSAAAGALGVQLEKIGHYKLGDIKNELSVHQIDAMVHLMYLVTGIWILLCLAIEGVWFVLTS